MEFLGESLRSVGCCIIDMVWNLCVGWTKPLADIITIIVFGQSLKSNDYPELSAGSSIKII